MTSTSTKLLVALTVFFLSVSLVSAQDIIDQTGSSDFEDPGFQIPEYESHEEIVVEFVAPFLFITLILQLLYGKVLHFIFRDQDQTPYAAPPWREDKDKPDVRKYATLMAITTTAILVPTVFWDYISILIGSLGLLVIFGLVLLVLYVMYLMVK